MNKQVIIGLVVAGLVIIGLAVYSSSQNTANEVASENTQTQSQDPAQSNGDAMMSKDDKMMADDDAMMSGDDKIMMSADGETMMSDDKMMAKSGSYKDYSQSTVQTEFSADNKVVLFFHAPWCPFCKSADTAFSTRTSEIPSGVTVLKTDYDSNDELKKKYGVTYQHTFVQIDASGNMITKWNGGDIDSLIKNLK